MAKKLSIQENISHLTAKIETQDSSGNRYSGTGFFFNLDIGDGKYVPLLITNKHVVKDMVKGRFLFTEKTADGDPILDKHFGINYEVDFEKMWVMHPDANVDLCALPINVLIKAASQLGHTLYYSTLGNGNIPNGTAKNDIDAIEDVLMVGYPNSLWDATNNLPIARKGITATHYNVDYNGEKKFLVDMAVFPGSSGSPVFIFNKGTFTKKDGGVYLGSRFLFLGIVTEVFIKSVKGEIKVVPVPTANIKLETVTDIPINLGIVIKAERILDFIPLFKK